MLRVFSAVLLITGAGSASLAAVDSSLLAMAPSGSQVIASVDVDGSRSSAFGQFFLRQLSAHDDSFQQLIEQTGFDPRRDLQSILVTAAPSQSAETSGRFAVIARGNFDQDRIKDAAQKKGSIVQQYQGIDLTIGKGKGQAAFAFPDVDLAVIGDLLSVKQVIQNRANPASLDPALQEQISSISGNDAWFASVLPPSFLPGNFDPDLKNPTSKSQALQSVIRSSGGIRFGTSAIIVFNAVTRSAQDATALADVIRFMSSMLQMQRQSNGQAALLAPALDSMKLDTNGESVHIFLQLPESTLEQFANPKGTLRSTR